MTNKELLRYCNEYLSYDAETGVIKWKGRASNRINIGDLAGNLRPDGGLTIQLNGKKYLSHRVAFLMHHSFLPVFVDHINRNRSDNRIENLRQCTHAENQRNGAAYKTNKSGYKGVSLYKDKIRWRASIQTNKRNKHIGIYECKKEAARAYNLAARMYHGEFAYTNLITEL